METVMETVMETAMELESLAHPAQRIVSAW
jgi:hypothetical protein